MCVLTYIPTGSGNFLLTNNRDENPSRPKALVPKEYFLHDQTITFPKDPLGGGTWIAHNKKQSVILLNGGHTIHKYNPPYRQSRGMVVLDYFAFQDPKTFYDQYIFEGIEAFTLVIVGEVISEIRWDHNGKTFNEFNAQEAKIWSSVTLYTPQIIEKRQQWFDSFLSQNPNPSREIALHFHENGGDGDEQNSLKMQRGELVKTLGISQIVKENGVKSMSYFPV